MAGIDIQNNESARFENQRFIQEALNSQDINGITDPLLKRLVEAAPLDLEQNKNAKQAYDRMYHTHSRGG